MMRWVLNHEWVGACRYTGFQHRSIRLKLECGHDQTRKASRGVPNKARCKECGWKALLQERERAK